MSKNRAAMDPAIKIAAQPWISVKGSPSQNTDPRTPKIGAAAKIIWARTAPSFCALVMYSVMLAPYERAPTARAPSHTGALNTSSSVVESPIVKLTLPATRPFQKVLSAGRIPSISAVK